MNQNPNPIVNSSDVLLFTCSNLNLIKVCLRDRFSYVIKLRNSSSNLCVARVARAAALFCTNLYCQSEGLAGKGDLSSLSPTRTHFLRLFSGVWRHNTGFTAGLEPLSSYLDSSDQIRSDQIRSNQTEPSRAEPNR